MAAALAPELSPAISASDSLGRLRKRHGDAFKLTSVVTGAVPRGRLKLWHPATLGIRRATRQTLVKENVRRGLEGVLPGSRWSWPLELSYSSLLLIEGLQIPRGGNGTTNLLDLGLNTRFQFVKELEFSQSPARQFAVGSVSLGHLKGQISRTKTFRMAPENVSGI